MFSERSQLDGKSIRHVPSRRCRSARRSSGLSFEAACTVFDVLRKFTENGTFRSSKVDILWNQYRDHVLAVSKHNLISTEGNFRLKTIKLELQFLICLKINLRPQATASTRFTREWRKLSNRPPRWNHPENGPVSRGSFFISPHSHRDTFFPPVWWVLPAALGMSPILAKILSRPWDTERRESAMKNRRQQRNGTMMARTAGLAFNCALPDSY